MKALNNIKSITKSNLFRSLDHHHYISHTLSHATLKSDIMRDVEHFVKWIFTPQIKGLRNFIYCESLNDLLNEIFHARRYNLFQFFNF